MKDALQEDEDFVNKKCTNEDSRRFYGAKISNKSLPIQLSSVLTTEINKEEYDCWCNVIRKDIHIK